MPITETQRQRRKKYLGASDASAVLNLNPWRSSLDVYYEKTGQLEESNTDSSSDAIEVGNYCEDAVLSWFAEQKGFNLKRNQNRIHKNRIMSASFDALVKGDPAVAIEAKTTGVTSRGVGEQWGEVETGEVPEYVALQCHHQMAVLPSVNIVYVPVLMGGVGFRHYQIERDQEMIDYLEQLETTFWKENVLKNIPPETEEVSLQTLKKLKRIPDKSLEISEELVFNWIEARKAARDAMTRKKEVETLILKALADGEAGTCSLGTVTYFSQSRKGYTVQPSTHRVLRFKENKKGK